MYQASTMGAPLLGQGDNQKSQCKVVVPDPNLDPRLSVAAKAATDAKWEAAREAKAAADRAWEAICFTKTQCDADYERDQNVIRDIVDVSAPVNVQSAAIVTDGSDSDDFFMDTGVMQMSSSDDE